MSTSMRIESVQVVADLHVFDTPLPMGQLTRHAARSGEILCLR